MGGGACLLAGKVLVLLRYVLICSDAGKRKWNRGCTCCNPHSALLSLTSKNPDWKTAAAVPPLLLPQKKGWGCSKNYQAQLRSFKRRLSGYASCAEALFDDFLRSELCIKE